MKALLALAIAGFLLGGCTFVPFTSYHSSSRTPAAPANGASASPASAKSGIQALPDLSAYRLGVADRLRIDVFGEGDLSMEVAVDGTGHFSYPLLGSILALQKTAREIQDTITSGLANGYLVNPDVRVTVIQYRPFYVIGQIHRPGAYAYVIGLTVEKALAIAGGMTNLASTRRIYQLHEDSPDGKRIRVGLDTLVLPGDTLMVEEGLF